MKKDLSLSMKTYLLFNQAPRREDVLGEWRYISMNS
jgi:hypothetical protein